MNDVEHTELVTQNIKGCGRGWLRSHWKALYHAKRFTFYFLGNCVPCKIYPERWNTQNYFYKKKPWWCFVARTKRINANTY